MENGTGVKTVGITESKSGQRSGNEGRIGMGSKGGARKGTGGHEGIRGVRGR